MPARRFAALPVGALALLLFAGAARAGTPTKVSVPGSYQAGAGCAGDWDPTCAGTHLTFDANDNLWQGTFTLTASAAGTPWKYKFAYDDAWTENYGLHGQPGGGDIPLTLATGGPVKFYFDAVSHWGTDNKSSTIATAVGTFQSELGCPGDWSPDCLRSWLQDPDGDGVYTFTTTALLAGTHQAKVAINEDWTVNYGAGGAPGGSDINFTVDADHTEVLFQWDSSSHALEIVIGGIHGDLRKARAHWLTRDTIAWPAGALPAGTSFALYADPTGSLTLGGTGVSGGTRYALTEDPAGLPAALKAKFPHLAGYRALKVAAADLDAVPALLRGQLAVSAVSEGKGVDASGVQLPGVLDDLYTYGGELGVSWQDGVPTLRLWAPTATAVSLLLYDDAVPATAPQRVAATAVGSTGVWSVTGQATWKNKFYLYEVTVYAPSTHQREVNPVTDPYSLSLSTNGTRSQIVDLNDPALAPDGWSSLTKPTLAAPEDAVVYELHVRDFSIRDSTVPAALRGTFAAFAQTTSDGMKHLRDLAEAGLTHVHLLPAFDFATVNEDRATRTEPTLPTTVAPGGQDAAAAVTAARGTDGYNWGYDPAHYTVPEGSYATDPNGATRIREFRQMVMALNRAGLRMVMDVVYNHTHSAGQDPQAVLDRVVPGYYHRLNLEGGIENSTCCANTATEHAMMEKLMVDSVRTWATAYKVDGFRFDLMGHHLKENIVHVRDALHALTPAKDGVEGGAILLYGEGWDFGEVAGNARGVNASQRNMAGTGVATFTDRLRDAVRGGGPFDARSVQGYASGLSLDPNGLSSSSDADQRAKLLQLTDLVRLGMVGNLSEFGLQDGTGHYSRGRELRYGNEPAGYTADPQEVINYVSVHDNETWFDALQAKAPRGLPMADRVRAYNLGLSLVALSQGIPLFHAGDDLLRSKSGDKNSYDSGDWFNALDFTYQSNNWAVGLPPGDNQGDWPFLKPLLEDPALKPGPAEIARTHDHFRELLKIRKSLPTLRLQTAEEIEKSVRFFNTGVTQKPGLIAMTIADPGDENNLTAVLVNASPLPITITITPLWQHRFELHPVLAQSTDPVVREATWVQDQAAFTIPGRTAAVFYTPEAEAPFEAGCGGCVAGGNGFAPFALALAFAFLGWQRKRHN